MIDQDGRHVVFAATATDTEDYIVYGVHDTPHGAMEHLEQVGFRYSTAPPDGGGTGWYREVPYARGRIEEWTVRP